jgi:hypothetical protein
VLPVAHGAVWEQELLSRSQFPVWPWVCVESAKFSACPLLEMVTGVLDGVPVFDPWVAVKERLAGNAESSEVPVTVMDTETICESIAEPLPVVTVTVPE